MSTQRLGTFLDTLLSAEADAVCGGEYGQIGPARTNRRNGYQYRDVDPPDSTLPIRVVVLGWPRYGRGFRRRARHAV